MISRRDITFTSGNIELQGTVFSNQNPTDCTCMIILSCGLGGCKKWFDDKAAELCMAGNDVFTFDFRGHGESGGVADADIMEDLYAAVKWAKNFSPGTPIILGGQCMGGLFSLHAADHVTGVIGIFVLGLTPEWVVTPDLWEIVQYNMELHKGGHDVRLSPRSFYEIYEKNDVREVVKTYNNLSTLIIHYERDEIAPVKSVYELYEQIRGPKDLIVLHGGKHVEAYADKSVNKLLLWWINQLKEGEKNQ